MMIRTLSILIIAAAASVLNGCSFSASSESSYDSSKSVFDSSKSASDLVSRAFKSSSDSSATDRQKYEQDVADYTAEYVHAAKSDVAGFRAHLGTLAERRGITNWESDSSSYVAIGRGLRQAKLGTPQYNAFKESLSGSDPVKMKAIEDGYQQ